MTTAPVLAGSGPRTRGGGLAHQERSPGPPRRARWPVGLAVAVYAALGLAAYFPTWPGDPGRIPQCTCADAGLNAWFLAATAHAVAGGHSLFFTNALNYPNGVNLTYNTQMPLLGVLAAPLTLTAGPVSSLNLLMWLAFPLSATSMFLVLRRWTSWTPAAFAGGLLYGFSPYMVGQSTAHLHLIFVPLPPLILLATFELFVRRSGRPWRWGLALGLLCAGQALISSEILVTTVVAAVIGLVVLAVARPGEVARAVSSAAVGVATALVAAGAVLAYPAAVFLAGPEHYPSGVASGSGMLIRSDLLGPVLPTSFQRLTPAAWASAGDSLTVLRVTSENGAYLGIPLLIGLAFIVVRFRHRAWIRFAAVMAVVAFVLSLGTPLSVDGHSTAIPLPAALFGHLPLVDQLVPSRISLLMWLFVAVAVALGLDGLHELSEGAGGAEGAGAAGGVRAGERAERGALRWAVAGLVGVVTVLSLLPRWPDPTVPTDLPPYFTSGAVDTVRPGTVALTYPYGAPLHAQPMVWQARSAMRFALVGGYALIPGGRGGPTLFPSLLQPIDVEQFLFAAQGGIPFYESPTVADNDVLVRNTRVFLRRYHVGVVLVDTATMHSARIDTLFTLAIGRPPVADGGIDAWYDVPRSPGLGATAR